MEVGEKVWIVEWVDPETNRSHLEIFRDFSEVLDWLQSRSLVGVRALYTARIDGKLEIE